MLDKIVEYQRNWFNTWKECNVGDLLKDFTNSHQLAGEEEVDHKRDGRTSSYLIFFIHSFILLIL
jgi:hypothetical protein